MKWLLALTSGLMLACARAGEGPGWGEHNIAIRRAQALVGAWESGCVTNGQSARGSRLTATFTGHDASFDEAAFNDAECSDPLPGKSSIHSAYEIGGLSGEREVQIDYRLEKEVLTLTDQASVDFYNGVCGVTFVINEPVDVTGVVCYGDIFPESGAFSRSVFALDAVGTLFLGNYTPPSTGSDPNPPRDTWLINRRLTRKP